MWFSVGCYWLRGGGGDCDADEFEGSALQGCGCCEDVDGGSGDAGGVAGEGGEVVDDSGEGVDRLVIVVGAGRGLRGSGRQSPSGGDWVGA